MKNYKEFTEEVFNHHIVQGSTEKGKVTHSGSLRQMQKAIRDPKMPTDHVLVKTRHDLKTGDDWKKHMHAEDATDNLLKKKKKTAQTISHPGYDAESKNEGIFGSTSAKKSRDKMFLARSRGNTIKKDEPVNELSKGLLQRAANTARDQAGQKRGEADKAASRVGDTSQPPGQNLKSKRANYQAAKKDYQAFKFSKAADKKEAWEKPRDKDFEKLGPLSKGELKKKKDTKEGVDMYDNKRKEAEMRKKARETPSSPETQAKLKRARAGEVVKESIKPQSHEYFGSGPFSGEYSDVATAVLRIAKKVAKEGIEEEEIGFEKMSDDKVNKAVTDAYLEKVQGEN